MKKSTQLRYLSMTLFIVGYVGMSYYMDPWLLFFMAMAATGFTTVRDVIELENVEKSLEDHKRITDAALKSIKELRDLLEKEQKENQ